MPDPFSPSLTGEYLRAMEAISARLMDALPAGDDLWRILGQTEALLLEAQAQQTPVRAVLPGGVAAFCQSIIDERTDGGRPVTHPASQNRPAEPSRRPSADSPAHRRRRQITAAAIVAWVLLVAVLLLWYVGVFQYLTGGAFFYRLEPHNFTADVTTLSDSGCTVTVPLTAHSITDAVLYADGTHRVTLVDVGFDEMTASSTETAAVKAEATETVSRYWWILLTYTVDSTYTRVSYVAPSESGEATLTLPNGETVTDGLEWGDEGVTDGGTAYVKLYIMKLAPGQNPGQNPDSTSLTATVRLAPMRLVTWRRVSVGIF